MMFKDEYFLDFINTEEIIVKVEQELIKNSKRIGRKEIQRLEPELEGKTDAT